MRIRVEGHGASHSNQRSLSVEHLQSIWQELNDSYFRNRLPAIDIQWSTRLTASARPLSEPNGSAHLLGGSGGTAWQRDESFACRFPLLSGQSFEEMRGTLAHEMIHQWQFDVKKYCPSHGGNFDGSWP